MSQKPDRLSKADEQALIDDCLAGNQAAWQLLYEKYRSVAWAVLTRVLGHSSDLEDLVQTVFIKVYRSLHKFEGRSKLSTWLYTICIHVAMDYRRKVSRQKKTTDVDDLPQLASNDPDPHQQAERAEAISILGRALSKMKEPKRNIIVLYDIMEVPADEIASMLGTPVPTVRSRLFYARRELARLLSRTKGVKK
ncbi:MAG: sigma-70 family RNA polymerase sigma factor [Deltaproteobacteria bacterium]|nr:sigma-70 family RNA polymerase sigma factor [Deltaproteobacteria bacterium]MBW1872319.1 sigma-70 family RNA polymerase sigma factor [Deltaproteobacteria bacterium]